LIAVRNEGSVRTSDGVEIAFRDYGGRGRGLVLLHGVGANLAAMDYWAARLGAGRRAVALDIRFCGQSSDPDCFRWEDTVLDVEAVVDGLALGAVDVVGHSLGGMVAGLYGGDHEESRVVSVDGFGPGVVSQGDASTRAQFDDFITAMLESFHAMTAEPETGNRRWRDAEIDRLCDAISSMGYGAPNVRQVAERQFVVRPDGTFRRHPARQFFDDAFAAAAGRNVLRMYRDCRAPLLLIRCSESGAPAILDEEIDDLAAANPRVETHRLPITHLAPAWDALDEVVALVADFFERIPTSAP